MLSGTLRKLLYLTGKLFYPIIIYIGTFANIKNNAKLNG